MAVASFRRAPLASVHSDYIQDMLSKLNVREGNYLDLTVAEQLEDHYERDYPWYGFVPQKVWAVEVYYPEEGEYTHSHHHTQRGAEIEAAHLENFGTKPHYIRVFHGYQGMYDYNKAILP